MIKYAIAIEDINSHLFSVSLSFTTCPTQQYTLSLPAWLPGSYMIRDFAKNIVEIVATDNNGDTVELNKQDKQTWTLIANGEHITVRYTVFAFDLSVRTAYLDHQRGFFNGSSTFLHVNELANEPCSLVITPPDEIKTWKVATGLSRAENTAKYAFGEYLADNYQTLIDCPVAIGEFEPVEFTVSGITHHLIFTSRHYGDNQRVCQDLTKLCQHHIDLFGEAPFTEYWFITHIQASGFGGLEHKNSTILQASRFDLPAKNTTELSENYQTFLSLCSHEYFHAWNVCRIKPIEFTPYNLQEESYTKQLWAYEGITSYYDDFSLYRTGIITFENYLTLLAKTATRVSRGTGEEKQSVAQSSFDAWTKFYQQGPDAINNIVSYYTKGALIALWLDLTIRDLSNNQYSLDHVMKTLWLQFGKTAVGTHEADIINIANNLCQQNITAALNAQIHNVERINLQPLLKKVGVDVIRSKFAELNKIKTTTSENYTPFLGALYQESANGLRIKQVLENSPAAKAGIAVNDVIIAIDDLKMTEQSIQKLANCLPENVFVKCHYFRDDQLHTRELAFSDSPTTGISFTEYDESLSSLWRKVLD